MSNLDQQIRRLGILMEDMNDKIDLLLEVVVPMSSDVHNLKKQIGEVRSNHETRITKFERRPA